MNANELIEAIRKAAATTIISPATLLFAGVLLIASQPLAWGHDYRPHVGTLLEKRITSDFPKCTPSWVSNVPKAELNWMVRKYNKRGGSVHHLLINHVAFTGDRIGLALLIQHNRNWLGDHAGQHGYKYEIHKMNMHEYEDQLNALNKKEQEYPRSSYCGYLPHIWRVLAYRYDHRD